MHFRMPSEGENQTDSGMFFSKMTKKNYRIFSLTNEKSMSQSEHLPVSNQKIGTFYVKSEDPYNEDNSLHLDQQIEFDKIESNLNDKIRFSKEAENIANTFFEKSFFCLQACPFYAEKDNNMGKFFLELIKKNLTLKKKSFAYEVQSDVELFNIDHKNYPPFTKCIFYNLTRFQLLGSESIYLEQAIRKIQSQNLMTSIVDWKKEIMARVLMDKVTHEKIAVMNVQGNPKTYHLNYLLMLMKEIEKIVYRKEKGFFCERTVIAGNLNCKVWHFMPTSVHCSLNHIQYGSSDAIYEGTYKKSLQRTDTVIHDLDGKPIKENPFKFQAKAEAPSIFHDYLPDYPLLGDFIFDYKNKEQNPLTISMLQYDLEGIFQYEYLPVYFAKEKDYDNILSQALPGSYVFTYSENLKKNLLYRIEVIDEKDNKNKKEFVLNLKALDLPDILYATDKKLLPAHEYPTDENQSEALLKSIHQYDAIHYNKKPIAKLQMCTYPFHHYGRKRLKISTQTLPDLYYEKLINDNTPGLSKEFSQEERCYIFDIENHPELEEKINPIRKCCHFLKNIKWNEADAILHAEGYIKKSKLSSSQIRYLLATITQAKIIPTHPLSIIWLKPSLFKTYGNTAHGNLLIQALKEMLQHALKEEIILCHQALSSDISMLQLEIKTLNHQLIELKKTLEETKQSSNKKINELNQEITQLEQAMLNHEVTKQALILDQLQQNKIYLHALSVLQPIKEKLEIENEKQTILPHMNVEEKFRIDLEKCNIQKEITAAENQITTLRQEIIDNLQIPEIKKIDEVLNTMRHELMGKHHQLKALSLKQMKHGSGNDALEVQLNATKTHLSNTYQQERFLKAYIWQLNQLCPKPALQSLTLTMRAES